MSHPLYTSAEAHSRETFLALMWALSYPGRVYEVRDGGDPLGAIAATLLDLETSCFTPASSLKGTLGRTGAQTLPPDQAAYHFYPSLDDAALRDIQRAPVGEMLYPDTGATLIVGCTLGGGDVLALQGPGVDGEIRIYLSGVPGVFWELRAAACRFPLGWDVYFVDGRRIMGLPRSVHVVKP